LINSKFICRDHSLKTNDYIFEDAEECEIHFAMTMTIDYHFRRYYYYQLFLHGGSQTSIRNSFYLHGFFEFYLHGGSQIDVH